MNQYKIKRQGEELIMQALPGAKFSTINDHDIDWRGIKISVRVRGYGGKQGNNSFTFASNFRNPEPLYILVGVDNEAHYFWVIPGKEISKKTSYYAKIKESVPYPQLKQVIADRAIL